MWAQLINVALGIWLMLAPSVLGFDGAPETIDRLIGPLVVLGGLLAIRDVTRSARYLLFLPALFLVLAPWFLHYQPGVALTTGSLTGIAISICAAIPGRRHERIGGGWLALLRAEPARDMSERQRA